MHRDAILNLVKDEVLHDENIRVTKKDNSDTLYGYEISMPFISFENTIEQINEDIRRENSVLSTLKGTLSRELSTLDSVTKAEQKRKADALKELRKTQEENNSKLSIIENKINLYEAKILEEKSKEQKTRDFKISQMSEQLKNLESENRTQKAELKKSEKTLEDLEKSIRDKFSAEISTEKQNKKSLKAQQESSKSLKEKEIEERVKEISDNYNRILQEQGVDTQKLQELQEIINESQKALEDIRNNREKVSAYNFNDKEKIGRIGTLKEQMQIEEEKKKHLEEQRDEEIGILLKKITDANEKLQKANDRQKRISSYLEEIEEAHDLLKLKEVSVSDKYFSNSDMEFIEADIEQFTKGVSKTKDLSYHIRDTESEIEKITREITKGFKEGSILNVPVLNDTINTTFEYIQILNVYIERMDSKTHEHGRGESLKLTSETIAYLKNSLDNMRLKVEKIEELKNKTNKKVAQSIKNISVLDFLKIELEEDKANPIIEKIDELIEYADRNSHIYIGGFIQDKDKEVHEKINNKIAKLQYEIETYRRSDISINDLFTIYFRISENGSDLGKITSLKNVGSNGTGIMARSIIYISLLHSNSIKTRVSDNQMFHCIIDEIGQISENFFEELMNFAESQGFSFLNGIPVMVEGMIALYPSVYTGYTEKNHSIMLNTTKEFIDVDAI